jgi:hypothetical protein
MKTFLAVASFATVLAQPLVRAGEVDLVDSPTMVNLVLSMLKGAQTVAICSFKLPEGMMIDKVIRGEPRKVGQLWNSTSFPQKPIVAFERIGDHLGDGRAELMETGYFELDQSKKFIVLDSVSSSETRNEKVLVSLDAIKLALTKKKAEQVGTGQPATRSQSKSECSDKPQLEAEGRSR